jgi:hypothetical protein
MTTAKGLPLLRRLLPLGAVVALAVSSATAAGPLKGEVEIAYWDADVEAEVGRETESSGSREAAFRGRVWVGGWAVKATYHRLEPGSRHLAETTTLINLDVLHRVISVSGNSYLAMGGGWERIKLEEGGSSAETSGARLVLDGRIGLAGIVYGYGEAAFYPWLSDSDVTILGEIGVGLRDGGGYEWELGVGVEPVPFLVVKAAYRVSTIDFDLFFEGDRLGSADFSAGGFLLSVGAHF